jgi:hypothetical protein
MKNINEAFSPEESKEIYDKFAAIVNTRRDNLVKKYGKEAERVAYASAVKQVKKKATQEPTIEEPMDQEQKLKEMIQAALSTPLSEKKKSFPDLTGDGKVTQADILKARGVELDEDLDLGHEDDEPHMIKGELYKIAQNAIALYKMLDQYDTGEQEVDLPAWWQSKVTKACTMLGSAKNYLEFELKEPQIDSMVNLASAASDTIDEKMSKKQVKKRGEIYDALKDQGMSDEKAGRIATSKAQKIKEAIFAKLKEKK